MHTLHRERSVIRKMLIGCIHSKEQKHKDKQDLDKEKYLNIFEVYVHSKTSP